MVLIGLLWIPVIQGQRGLYFYLQAVQGYLAPPIFVVFFLGIYWKRLNAKGCLAAGYPFVFGFSVYESFESAAVAKTGKVPMPSAKEKSLGGHAVLAVGYDDAGQSFIVMNSWSAQWGDQGYFHLPYAYIADDNLADDFWTVRVVEG